MFWCFARDERHASLSAPLRFASIDIISQYFHTGTCLAGLGVKQLKINRIWISDPGLIEVF